MTVPVSVVIPIFNRAGTIGRAIESCLAQTWPPFEIVLVDDCSTDDLQSALQDFLDDQRVRLVQQPTNQGVSAARNAGVQHAKGDLIAFLDSDDAWYPTKLEKQLAKIAALGHDQFLCGTLTEVVSDTASTKITPTRRMAEDVAIGDFMFVHKVRRRLSMVADSRAANAALSDGYFVHVNSMILPKTLALETPFRTSMKQYEDLAFLVDLGQKGIDFVLIEEALAIQHDDRRPGRLGNQDDIRRGHRFLEEMGDALSPDARLAFETSHLAHLFARERPLYVAKMVFKAFSRGLLSLRSVTGILFRSFFGQASHRTVRDGLNRLRPHRDTL